MEECLECDTLLDGGGGIVCWLYRHRKYLIGILVGAVLCYVIAKRRK